MCGVAALAVSMSLLRPAWPGFLLQLPGPADHLPAGKITGIGIGGLALVATCFADITEYGETLGFD